jgi:hypothetical protein
VTSPSHEDINRIIDSHHGSQQYHEELLEVFWNLWHDRTTSPTPRQAIQLFALASSFASYEINNKQLLNVQPTIKTVHLQRAFEELYSQTKNEFRL